ncbi:MAG: anti-ECFsigma factor, ChrR [Caulobacteraceae bacterium]|nr:anti-ECFsigma factor, ChrR [Caulobacteraceae bacterium]
MIPQHHPTETLLVDYGTGALDRNARLVVAGHLGVCESCRRVVAEIEELGGALLAALAPAPLQPDALDMALARIERPAPVAITSTAPNDWIAVPWEVIEAARTRRRWAAPGVWVAPIARGPGKARGYLLGIAAGMGVPRHTHRGAEMICVLKGAYRDGDALHRPGDFAWNDETVEHQPRITSDGECVCLVAAGGPLVPRDWMGRIFQPLVGI